MAVCLQSHCLSFSANTFDSHQSSRYSGPISSQLQIFPSVQAVSKLPQMQSTCVSSKSSSLQWKLSFNQRSCNPKFSADPRGPLLHRIVLSAADIAGSSHREPLRVMISGPPASGKGTQSELIMKKYGLVHIAAGDLLRAEVAAGTENGTRAKQYMDQGKLVPSEIVVTMVKERLSQPDAQEKGWLLDGYPRSSSQAEALEAIGIRPHVFILLEVPEEILVDRVVGRRLDPVTGKIYHLTYSPPETPEIALRLTQRSDDTVEKVKLRLQTHHKNVEVVLSIYKDLIRKVDGTLDKNDVFSAIQNILEDPEVLSPRMISSIAANSI